MDNIQMKNFFELSNNIYQYFEEYCDKKNGGYIANNFPIFSERLDGLESGLYVFAAESNMGKTAVMQNLLLDLCRNPDNNLFGIYYSLDDSRNEVIPRIIAADKLIPISVASKPNRYREKINNGEENSLQYKDWLDKREEAIKELKEQSNKFMIMDNEIEIDGVKLNTAEKIHEHMIKVQIFVKSINPEANIIVAIDSLNDLRFSDKYTSSKKELCEEIAKTVKDWTKELDIIIFGSLHLRKLNSNRRPTLDDIKDSIEWIYESSVTFLLHNDVSKNKQNANISYTGEDDIKMPVIEIDWAKNKKSSFKGRTFCYFSPNYSKTTECPEEVMNRYNQLIYAL